MTATPTQQTEAQRLSLLLATGWTRQKELTQAADELDRLHAENEALKAERARSGLAHRKAVQEAVREAEDAAKLATATACSDVCADMAQQLRGHGDVAGAEIADALRDAIRARGAA